jgi:hypothetical protein
VKATLGLPRGEIVDGLAAEAALAEDRIAHLVDFNA